MEWFQTFLVLSVAGSLLAGILLALKKWTGKQFSPTWQYVLWVGVLLVMVVPVSVKVPALVQPMQEKQVVQTVPLPAEQTMTEQPVPVDTVEAPAGEICLLRKKQLCRPFLGGMCWQSFGYWGLWGALDTD